MKRLIAVLLVIATLVGMMSCMAGCGATEYVSRGEWITALAERFGMDSTVSETDYFTDVDESVSCYPYVQSCGDWGVLSNSESTQFKPENDATVEFALETAILAAEVDIGEQSVIDYALSQGIIKDTGFLSVRGRLTPETAQSIIDWTQNLYINGTVEPRAIVEYSPNLKNFVDSGEQITATEEEGVYSVPADVAQSLSGGDVLLIPTEEYPEGIGVKVDDITMNEDGTATITTLEPEISELLDGLDVAGPVTWSNSDVQLAEGFSFGGAGGMTSSEYDSAYVTTLDNRNFGGIQAQELANGVIPDINLNVNFTKGTIQINPEWDSLFGLGESFSLSAEQSMYATDPKTTDGKKPGDFFKEKTSVIPVGSAYGNSAYKNQMAINAYKDGKITINELKKELDLTENQEEKNPKTMENKFSGGYEITGSLSITDIKFDVGAKYSPFNGLKASMTCGYKVSSSLSIKGKLSESLNFATIRVPVATGVMVNVKFYLCLDANGELKVTATLSNCTKYSLDNGKVKKTNSDLGSDLTSSFSLKIDFGPKVTAEVAVGGIPLFDVGIKAVVRGKYTTELKMTTEYSSEQTEQGLEELTITRRTYFNLHVNAYIPIVTLEVNGNPQTVANKLKLKASWTLIGEGKAKTFPIYETGDNLIWEEILVLTEGEQTEETTLPPEDSDVTYGDFLDIDTYFLNIDEGGQASIGVSVLPTGYSMSDLIWSSSNGAVATVSGGTVTAVSGGVATITVRTADGKFYKQCGVSVTAASDGFTPLDENLGKV